MKEDVLTMVQDQVSLPLIRTRFRLSIHTSLNSFTNSLIKVTLLPKKKNVVHGVVE